LGVVSLLKDAFQDARPSSTGGYKYIKRNITAKALHGYMPKYIALDGGQLVAHPILRFWNFAFHPLSAASIRRKQAEV